jgi:hypothetical protein
MAQDYVLSGGEFGGATVEVNQETEITKTDDHGNVWIYQVVLSKTDYQANFRQYIPADEVNNNGSN